MHGQMLGCADDDELTCTFEKVKTASFYFGHHGVAPHLAFHITDGAPDDSAVLCCLGTKKLVKERRIAPNEPGCAKL
jgi:hypothetical protein